MDVYAQGGAGAIELAEMVADTAPATSPKPLYTNHIPLLDKISTLAREIYGAGSVYIESEARKKLERYSKANFAGLPVCVAKTQSSLSDNPKAFGAPTGWTLTITDAHLSAGAGFIVVIAGNMMRMPGLGKTPQAFYLDVDSEGAIQGLR